MGQKPAAAPPARWTWRCALGAFAVAMLAATSASALSPDAFRSLRQQRALQRVVKDYLPTRSYAGAGCESVGTDAKGMVAALELGRRGLAGGITAADAAAPAQRIADAIFAGQGTTTTPGNCNLFKLGPTGSDAAVALAYALHRYGATWPAATKESIRRAVEDTAWTFGPYLQNQDLPIPAMALLAGEALGRPALFDRGRQQLQQIFDGVLKHGGLEMNSPSYSAWHFPTLIFLQVLADATARGEARLLLDYELLVIGHLYLPGGAIGVPQSRDYAGGAADDPRNHTFNMLWLLVGDPLVNPDLTYAADTLVAAATDYAVPELIRSIFLEKAGGYTFYAEHEAQQGTPRTASAFYPTPLGGQGFPIEGLVMPGGTAMMGFTYGWYWTVHMVSSGVYVKRPSGGFAILYQHQPLVLGDTGDDGTPILGTGLDSDPSDFTGELYDFERAALNRTMIALFDPTPRAGVVRNAPYTQVHLPNWAALGGEATQVNGWRVGRMGEVYVAFRPLGTIELEESRDGGTWTYLRLTGKSGGITELATTADFPTLDAYAADLATRRVSFAATPLAADVDARKTNGARALLRLEYAPERRLVNGAVQPDTALYHGLMESEFAAWDEPNRRLTVTRQGYGSLVYDWENATLTLTPAPGTPGRPQIVAR